MYFLYKKQILTKLNFKPILQFGPNYSNSQIVRIIRPNTGLSVCLSSSFSLRSVSYIPKVFLSHLLAYFVKTETKILRLV